MSVCVCFLAAGWYLCYWRRLFRDLVIRSDYLSPRVEPGSKVTAGSTVAIFCHHRHHHHPLHPVMVEAGFGRNEGCTVYPKNKE